MAHPGYAANTTVQIAVEYRSRMDEPLPENTHQRGKYHCTADFLIDWFGFDQTNKAVAYLFNQSNAAESNKINRRSAIQ